MSMMNVGVVLVRMHQPCMYMRMGMRLLPVPGKVMLMLVVFVMPVPMLVLL